MKKMMIREGLVIGIVILFFGMNIIPSYAGNVSIERSPIQTINGTILYVGGTGPDNYTKIQDAIEDASDGDTVYVYNDSSPYFEHLTIYKSLILLGEDRDSTVINGSDQSEVVVQITADGVNLSGFTIQNYGEEAIDVLSNNTHIWNNNIGRDINGFTGYGIRLYHSNGNIVSDNYIHNTFRGISILYSEENKILTNTIHSNNLGGIHIYESHNNDVLENTISSGLLAHALSYKGIHLWGSNSNTIMSNIITSEFDDFYDNDYCGLFLWDSSDNEVAENTFENCGLRWFGIYQNIVEDNTINGKPIVYLVGESDKIIDDAGQVVLIQCDSITVQNSEISNTGNGIELLDTHNCLISNNAFVNNWNGIQLESSGNDRILDNTFLDNRYSINLKDYPSHITISNNTIQNSAIGILGSLTHSTIAENIIRDNGQGIKIGGIYGSKNYILSNTITNNWNGIVLSSSNFNTISNNIIANNTNGLHLNIRANHNTIISNTIQNNIYGVNLSYVRFNTVKKNNFVENEQHAFFDTAFRNHWLKNYWEGDKLPPVRINGMISFYKTDYWGNIIWELHIPWVNFDWFPAQRPYDI